MLIHEVKFEIYFELRSWICSVIIDGEITISPLGLEVTIVFLCQNIPVNPDLDHSLTITSVPGPPNIRPGFLLSLSIGWIALLFMWISKEQENWETVILVVCWRDKRWRKRARRGQSGTILRFVLVTPNKEHGNKLQKRYRADVWKTHLKLCVWQDKANVPRSPSDAICQA